MSFTLSRPAVANASLARRVVIAVPTLNEAAHIEACLRSLRVEGGGVPILVLDGGSTDGTQEIVERLAEEEEEALLRLVENPRRRQAAAVNLAAEIAPADRDILVRCDAHALYPPGFALALAAVLEETEADSVVVPMDAVPRTDAGPFERALACIVDTRLGSGGAAHRGGKASGLVDHGHHAAFRRERFQALKGYCETMDANEDAEYDTRLLRAGGRIWLESPLRIRYFVRRTPGTLWGQYARYGSGRAEHLLRHRKLPRIRQVLPALHVVMLGLSVALFPVWAPATLYALCYGAALGGAALWALPQIGPAAAIRVPLALLVLHVSWGIGFTRRLLSGGERSS